MAISFASCKVERSTNGSVWTDIRADAAMIRVSGGERKMGKFFNFSLDYPVLTRGKRDSLQVASRSIYSEGAADTFEVARAAYENGTDFYLRWSPEGGAIGDFLFTMAAGTITNPPYPGGEAESADPVTFEMNVETALITKSVIS